MAVAETASRVEIHRALGEQDRGRKAVQLQRLAQQFRLTVLDILHQRGTGHWGGAVAEILGRRAPAKMDFVGVPDCFAESGPYMELLRKFGISTEEIESRARQLVEGAAA